MNERWEETTVDGARTRRWSLAAAQCAELGLSHIAWLGCDTVYPPYRRVRLAPTGSFVLACLAGEGRIFLEGRWQRVTAGQLCLAPPRVLNAFHALGRRPWTFAWIRYQEPAGVEPVVGAGSPLRLTEGAADLGRVLAGLRAEHEQGGDPVLMRHWVQLAHGLASRAARPWRHRSRVAQLWATVALDLATDWKLTTLAGAGAMSAEHLRRVCRRELGRTPMAHVTYMRIQRAQDLLESGDAKLETIAAEVGYRSALVFSRAFVRCVGLTPSEYRRRDRRAAGGPKERRESRAGRAE